LVWNARQTRAALMILKKLGGNKKGAERSTSRHLFARIKKRRTKGKRGWNRMVGYTVRKLSAEHG